MTEELILSGADIVKVGICPGSVCTTRVQTGVGYSRLVLLLSVLMSLFLGGHIIADGGCIIPGDVAKGFAGGAPLRPCLEECLQDMMKEGGA